MLSEMDFRQVKCGPNGIMANQTLEFVAKAIHSGDLCNDKLWPQTTQKDEDLINGRKSKLYIAKVSVVAVLALAVTVIVGLLLYAKIKSCLV